MHPLTEDQVREFHELGYTVIHNAAGTAALRQMRSAAEQQLQAAPPRAEIGKRNDGVAADAQ